MARLARFAVPSQPHYILLRARPGTPCHVDDEDAALLLSVLGSLARQEGVDVHAFCLLPDSLQVVATPHRVNSLGKVFQGVGRAYVSAYNRRHGHMGTLWQGRFVSAPVESGAELLGMIRLIELSPLRNGLVATPEEHSWSSARHHLGLAVSGILVDPPAYWMLGNTPFDREAAYRALLGQACTPLDLDKLERAKRGWAVGSDAFIQSMAEAAGRRAAPQPAGRPRKTYRGVERTD